MKCFKKIVKITPSSKVKNEYITSLKIKKTNSKDKAFIPKGNEKKIVEGERSWREKKRKSSHCCKGKISY